MRSGLLRLAEALTFRGDVEGVSSTVRALVTTLRSGEKCNLEPELVSKGTWGPAREDPSPVAPRRGPTLTRQAAPCGPQPSLCCGDLMHAPSPHPGLTSLPSGSSSPQGSSRAPSRLAQVWAHGVLLAWGWGLSLPEPAGLRAATQPQPLDRVAQHGLSLTVLRGLIAARSPYLEEMLAALFPAVSASPACRPIAVVTSLLLQDKAEPPAPGQQDTDGCR